MYRKRATPRFYILLAALLAGAFFLVRGLLPTAATEDIVSQATASYKETVEVVIVRDEEVVSFDGSGTIVYSVSEGARVKAGDTVAEIYSSGYSEKVMKQLETVRQDIRIYHQSILSNIVDNELDRLENNVEAKAVELKKALNDENAGNYSGLEQQLEQAMEERQEYLRQNQRSDMKLNQLYENEAKYLASIESWKTDKTATQDGIVSYYMDGCERFLSPDNLSKLTVGDIKSIIDGQKPVEDEVQSRFQQDIFRLIKPDAWDALLIGDESIWKPVNGQMYSFQIEGYEDVIYSGTVVKVQKEGRSVMAQLSVQGEMGPVMNLRSGSAVVGIDLSGLSVPVKAIATQNGQTGIWINDMPGGTFVPVEVLSSDSKNAIIQPAVEGSIAVGQRILIK